MPTIEERKKWYQGRSVAQEMPINHKPFHPKKSEIAIAAKKCNISVKTASIAYDYYINN
jgi:hypothetical protein